MILALSLLASLAGGPVASFEMTLRPMRDATGEVTGIEVTQRVNDPSVSNATPFSLTAPITYAAVSSPVEIKYTALVQPPSSPNGPAFGIRPAGGGVSGSGGGFLLLPENLNTTVSRVRWDLSGLTAGSIGVTSFGEGAFEVPGKPDELNQGWMMAGPLHRYSAPDTCSPPRSIASS